MFILGSRIVEQQKKSLLLSPLELALTLEDENCSDIILKYLVDSQV